MSWATNIDLSAVTTDLYTVGGLVIGVTLVMYGFKRVRSMIK